MVEIAGLPSTSVMACARCFLEVLRRLLRTGLDCRFRLVFHSVGVRTLEPPTKLFFQVRSGRLQQLGWRLPTQRTLG